MREFIDLAYQEEDTMFEMLISYVSSGKTVYYVDKSTLTLGEVNDLKIGKIRFLTSQLKLNNNSVTFFYEKEQEEK